MANNYFPHTVQKGETLGKIVDKSGEKIKKNGLKNNIYVGQIVEYKNGKLSIGEESAYKNVKLRTNIDLNNLSNEFNIKKGDWISKVIGKENTKKFRSVLNKFPIQLIGDKVKINGNTISLIRGGKTIKTLIVGGKVHGDEINNNNYETFYQNIEELRNNIKEDYKKLKDSNNYNNIKNSAQYKKIPSLLKGNGMFGEGGLSDRNKLPIPNNEGKLIARGTFERNDGKLTLPTKSNPNSFRLLKRKDGFYILGFYGTDGNLKIGTYVSPGKGTKTGNKTPYGYGNNIKPMFDKKVNGSKYTHIDHISSNKSKAFMMYSVGIKGPFRFHFYTTNGKNISGGCARLPLAYAKKIFEEVRTLEKQNKIPTYYSNKLY